jgi:hypothetical protein
MCYILVQMAFPVFHQFDADGTIRTNGLHLEGFPHLAWEALSTAGYTTPVTYEVSDFERLGVPRCRLIITVLPHPDLKGCVIIPLRLSGSIWRQLGGIGSSYQQLTSS